MPLPNIVLYLLSRTTDSVTAKKDRSSAKRNNWIGSELFRECVNILFGYMPKGVKSNQLLRAFDILVSVGLIKKPESDEWFTSDDSAFKKGSATKADKDDFKSILLMNIRNQMNFVCPEVNGQDASTTAA